MPQYMVPVLVSMAGGYQAPPPELTVGLPHRSSLDGVEGPVDRSGGLVEGDDRPCVAAVVDAEQAHRHGADVHPALVDDRLDVDAEAGRVRRPSGATALLPFGRRARRRRPGPRPRRPCGRRPRPRWARSSAARSARDRSSRPPCPCAGRSSARGPTGPPGRPAPSTTTGLVDASPKIPRRSTACCHATLSRATLRGRWGSRPPRGCCRVAVGLRPGGVAPTAGGRAAHRSAPDKPRPPIASPAAPAARPRRLPVMIPMAPDAAAWPGSVAGSEKHHEGSATPCPYHPGDQRGSAGRAGAGRPGSTQPASPPNAPWPCCSCSWAASWPSWA